MFFPGGEDRMLADRRRGEHMTLDFAPPLVTVRWPGMFLEDRLAAPRSRSWPAAVSAGYRPVLLRSRASRWLLASR